MILLKFPNMLLRIDSLEYLDMDFLSGFIAFGASCRWSFQHACEAKQ